MRSETEQPPSCPGHPILLSVFNKAGTLYSNGNVHSLIGNVNHTQQSMVFVQHEKR